MSAFAETLTDRERRRGRIHAYFACYFGCISEVMLDSSAIIILYVGMLGGSAMTAIPATSANIDAKPMNASRSLPSFKKTINGRV